MEFSQNILWGLARKYSTVRVLLNCIARDFLQNPLGSLFGVLCVNLRDLISFPRTVLNFKRVFPSRCGTFNSLTLQGQAVPRL